MSMKKYLKPIAAFALITILFGTLYVLVLQQNRLQANDNPMNIATEAAAVLAGGVTIPENQISRLNVLTTTNPFYMIYDQKGKPIAGSGYIDGKLAELPTGVIQHAEAGKPHAVTWAPVKDKKFATVTVKGSKFYVTSGQSLANVERRADTLRKWWALGYVLTLLTLLATLLAPRISKLHFALSKRVKQVKPVAAVEPTADTPDTAEPAEATENQEAVESTENQDSPEDQVTADDASDQVSQEIAQNNEETSSDTFDIDETTTVYEEPRNTAENPDYQQPQPEDTPKENKPT